MPPDGFLSGSIACMKRRAFLILEAATVAAMLACIALTRYSEWFWFIAVAFGIVGFVAMIAADLGRKREG